MDAHLLSFPTISNTAAAVDSSATTDSSFDPLRMAVAGNTASAVLDDYDNDGGGGNEDKSSGHDVSEFLREKLDIAPSISKTKTKTKATSSFQSFESMRLSDNVLKSIRKMGFRYPTPIQRQAIPVILAERDVVAMARTGSGKTAAFAIPLVHRLKEHSNTVGVRALIISPTRELVQQTFSVVRKLAKNTDLRVCSIVGGSALDQQFSDLANNPDIIVATPGRFLHIIADSGLSMKRVEYVVFDEADRLFELGLKLQLHQLLSKLPNTRQTVLVSATMPSELVDFVKVGLANPEFIRLDAETKISDELTLSFFTCSSSEKEASLMYILREFVRKEDLTIIFTCTRHHCEYLQSVLKLCGFDSVVIFGSMEQIAREQNLSQFKKKKTRIMITTDLAARGIDIPMLENVINYDFPTTPKLFIHRVGRAARAGRTGTAFSIVSPVDLPYMVDLYSFLGLSLDKRKEDANDVVEESDSLESDDATKRHLFLRRVLRKYDGFHGSFPQSILDDRCEDVIRLVQHNDDITALRTSCEKAYKLYSTTRPSSSKSSVGKAKLLSRDIHPMILEIMSKEQRLDLENMQKRMSIVDMVRAYKPQQTVFETEVESEAAQLMSKRRQFLDLHLAFKNNKKDQDDEDQNEINKPLSTEEETATPATSLSDVLMRRIRKRQDDDYFLEKETGDECNEPKRKKSKRTSYKDEKFYISYEPEQGFFEKKEIEDAGYSIDRRDTDVFHNAMQSSAMEITMDENDSILKRRNLLRWDKKTGKYMQVRLNAGERLDARMKIRNEAGALVKKNDKRNLYAEWKKRTKKRIQLPGEEEENQWVGSGAGAINDTIEVDDEQDSGKNKRRQDRGQKGRSRRDADNLKTPQQIMKERKKKRKEDEDKKVKDKIKELGYARVKQDFHTTNMAKKRDEIKKTQERVRNIVAKKRKGKQRGRKGK